MPGSAAPPPDHRHTPGRRSHPATAVQTKTPRSLPRRGTPFGILSASAPWPSDVLSQPLMAAQSGQDTTSRLAWDNAISLQQGVMTGAGVEPEQDESGDMTVDAVWHSTPGPCL